ncbi:MAG: MBL fold metallo-hydrolase [Syntrophomonas sp.]
MQVKVSIVVENTTPVPLLTGEYGFSALITVGDLKILFDTGSADALFKNSRVMGIKLEEIENLVISHGHFDHSTALLPLLNNYGKKKIFTHSQIFSNRFFVNPRGHEKGIGVPFTKQEILDAGAEFIFTDRFSEIFPAVYLSGEIPRKNDFEDTGGNFKIKSGNEMIEDTIVDDMALIIDHPDGLIIISGCAHAGVINTIKHAQRMTARSQVLAFIGGTHLINAGEERITNTVASLKELDVGKIVVCHCTGFHAAARLYNELGPRVIKGETGMVFQF